jgi:hypothetical protein
MTTYIVIAFTTAMILWVIASSSIRVKQWLFALMVYRVSNHVVRDIMRRYHGENKPNNRALTVQLLAKRFGVCRENMAHEVSMAELAKSLAKEFGFDRGVSHFQNEHLLFVFYGEPTDLPR